MERPTLLETHRCGRDIGPVHERLVGDRVQRQRDSAIFEVAAHAKRRIRPLDPDEQLHGDPSGSHACLSAREGGVRVRVLQLRRGEIAPRQIALLEAHRVGLQ